MLSIYQLFYKRESIKKDLEKEKNKKDISQDNSILYDKLREIDLLLDDKTGGVPIPECFNQYDEQTFNNKLAELC